MFAMSAGGHIGGIIVDQQSVDGLDWVKLLGKDQSGKIIFKYKAKESSKIDVYQADKFELKDEYKNALLKSKQTGQWQPVKIEDDKQ
jgi:hypothetical protein